MHSLGSLSEEYMDWVSGQKKKKNSGSTNSIDLVFGESGIFFPFFHIWKFHDAVSVILKLHFWYLVPNKNNHDNL